MRSRRASTLVLLAALLLPPSVLTAQAPAPQTSKVDAPRTVWYFYRVKWGAQERFLDLFQKNHYPVLEAQLGSRLTSIKTYVPTYHGDGRADWTFAVALTFKNTAALVEQVDEMAIARKLYKDFDTWRDEERERFELLEAHWDVPLNEIDLEMRQPSSQ
ncbi:MAG: hypothetical protein ACRD2X_05205 [Vicinamibacteraceae bacterium]